MSQDKNVSSLMTCHRPQLFSQYVGDVIVSEIIVFPISPKK